MPSKLVSLKRIVFRAKYGKMGDKIIIIVPKNYHNDIMKMDNPIEVSVQDLE